MAETKYWTNGAGTGNFQTAANWSTGNVPGAADTCVFDARSTADVTAGLTGNAFALAAIIGTPGYTGTIGDSSGTALTVQDITTLQWASSGPLARFALSGGTTTCTTVKLGHTGTVSLGAGTWGASGTASVPSLYNTTGTLNIAAASVLDFTENVGGTINVLGAPTAGGTVTCSGGVVTLADRTGLTLNVKAGYVKLTGACTVTLGIVEARAVLQDNASGTTTRVAVMPNGSYTLAGIAFSTKTITNLNPRPGASLKYTGLPGCTVTLTNAVVAIGDAPGGSS